MNVYNDRKQIVSQETFQRHETFHAPGTYKSRVLTHTVELMRNTKGALPKRYSHKIVMNTVK